MVHLGEVGPAVWDVIVELLQTKVDGFQEDDISKNWRKSANTRRFDRELFERYGYFKGIILHPTFQLVKQFIIDHFDVDFDMIVGEPLMPISTTLIVLFMLNKRVSYSVLFLIAAFVFNVNPIYVSLSLIVYWLMSSKKVFPKQYNKNCTSTLTCNESESLYDHVLIGNDIATLYTAALLSRVGHRCCIVQPSDCPQLEICPQGAPFAVPVVDLSVGKVERYQILLDAVDAVPTRDRITFSPIGCEKDGYTSTVFEVVHTTSKSDSSRVKSTCENRQTEKQRISLSLRAGETALSSEIGNLIHIDSTALLAYLQSMAMSLQLLALYLITKVTSPIAWKQSGHSKTEGLKTFGQLAETSVNEAAFQCEDDEHSSYLRTCLNALAAVGAQEGGLCDKDLSTLCLAQTVANAASGLFYPDGGMTSVVNALTLVVEGSGGRVIRGADAVEVLLEEVSSTGAVKATGVATSDGVTYHGTRSVVSGLGMLCSYTRLLPAEAVGEGTRTALATLRESRPVVRVVYWLDNRDRSLVIASCDYVEFGGDSDASVLRVWSPSAKDSKWKDSSQSDFHVIVVEIQVEDISALVQQKEVSFSGDGSADTTGPLMYFGSSSNSSCSEVEKECPSSSSSSSSTSGYSLTSAYSRGGGGDDKDTLGFTLILTEEQKAHFRQHADAKLQYLYPLTVGREVFVHVDSPCLGGHRLANTTSKYSCPLSATTEIQNFFLTGRDLTTSGLAGDLQSGWVAVNAILGYTSQDLLNKRNVVSDLQTTV